LSKNAQTIFNASVHCEKNDLTNGDYLFLLEIIYSKIIKGIYSKLIVLCLVLL